MSDTARPVAVRTWQSRTLDVADCERTELVLPLLEHERAGVRPETWPPQVRALIDSELGLWWGTFAPTREPRAVTYGLERTERGLCCVVVLHHQPRNKAPT